MEAKKQSSLAPSGDDNTKFFHHVANGRKQKNTIWAIQRNDGTMATSFEDIAAIGTSHFKNLFKAEQRSTIEAILKVASLFPHCFVDQDQNESLMAEVTEEELQRTLHSFQKDKSLGPDGLPVEFYSGTFEILGQDLLKTIEYSRTTGQVLASFNSTFITLIPKSDNPQSFDQFHPISLCNNIYKIITKIIANRLKEILADNISGEQFGFLRGRQIHQAIGIAQEGLHSIHSGRQKVVIYKVDLAKAFDRVSWLYFKLLLIHLGFSHSFVLLIICYLMNYESEKQSI
jgi:hypothetical protein